MSEGWEIHKLADIRRNEEMATFLTNVDKDFYQEVRQSLDSMMDTKRTVTGELRDGYAAKIRRAIIDMEKITARRLDKIFGMAMANIFDNTVPDLVQATPEEKRIYGSFCRTINDFRTRGGFR